MVLEVILSEHHSRKGITLEHRTMRYMAFMCDGGSEATELTPRDRTKTKTCLGRIGRGSQWQ